MFKYLLNKLKRKNKDTNMIITNEPIRICNHKFNKDTIMLGGSGDGKVRRYLKPKEMSEKEK